MRYRKPSIDDLLNGLVAEAWACQKFEEQAKHLGYLHAIVHELEYQLCQARPKGYGDDKGSVIERILWKLEYE
jgi:hypothetical protein